MSGSVLLGAKNEFCVVNGGAFQFSGDMPSESFPGAAAILRCVWLVSWNGDTNSSFLDCSDGIDLGTASDPLLCVPSHVPYTSTLYPWE